MVHIHLVFANGQLSVARSHSLVRAHVIPVVKYGECIIGFLCFVFGWNSAKFKLGETEGQRQRYLVATLELREGKICVATGHPGRFLATPFS